MMAEPPSPVDLPVLQAEITALGEKIKSLKEASPPDKAAIAVAVNDLLVAKRVYAENNNGIGSDGKPFEQPLTNAQKKTKAKADKSAPSEEDKVTRSIGMYPRYFTASHFIFFFCFHRRKAIPTRSTRRKKLPRKPPKRLRRPLSSKETTPQKAKSRLPNQLLL
jgi:hypothetical protein